MQNYFFETYKESKWMSLYYNGRKDAKGGHCLLAWPKVTRPVELGGLGIS